MVHLDILFGLIWVLFVPVTNSKKTYGDMFPNKYKPSLPFPIPGWEPDTKPWDESLYPAFKQELTRRHGKTPRVRLTSDSPAMNGSCISFTAALEFPPCQKEGADVNLLNDENCDDGMASASGQGRLGSVGWLDDYGFGKCMDKKSCNVFPDGKPFPQTSDWRHRGYVYVWHTMGQYFETYDGSSSHLTLNTTNMTIGAGEMEVMVYHKRERRKFSPLSTDTTVYIVTDKIPISVNISQKEAVKIKEKNVFYKGSDVIFKVQVHDPSNYLKTADAVDFIWDFQDGSKLVTHSNVATHTYNTLGNFTVSLLVKAAFPITCPPPTPTPQARTTEMSTPSTVPHTSTSKIETTKAPIATSSLPITTPQSPSSAVPTTKPFHTDAHVTSGTTATPVPETGSAHTQTGSTHTQPLSPLMIKHTHFVESDCFRYMYGSFESEIIIIEPPLALYNELHSKILNEVTNTSVNFMVTCTGSVPSVACTIVADSTCQEVNDILCDDAAPSGEGCKNSLTRIFQTPGTYCINIKLGVPGGLALATTTSVSVGNSPDKSFSTSSHVAVVVVSSSAVLVSIFAFIAIMIYRRHKEYRPVGRPMLDDAERNSGVDSWGLRKLRSTPANDERRHLLAEKPV